MLDIKNYISEKYGLKNDNDDIKYIMNKFVSENYGNFLSVDNVEKLDKINAYVNIYCPEIINNYYFVKQYKNIFFITMDINDGRATITGPERNTAIKLFNDRKHNEIKNNENTLIDIVYKDLLKISGIKISLTPLMEIIRELGDKGVLYLDMAKTSDIKRLNYFRIVEDMDIFQYEIKYNVYIVRPGDKFLSIIHGDYDNILLYIFKSKKDYFINFTSIKPYIRTAYAYYYIATLTGSNMEVDINYLLKEYNNLYSKKSDMIKFKNYIDSLVESGIFIRENDMIKGNKDILKILIKK